MAAVISYFSVLCVSLLLLGAALSGSSECPLKVFDEESNTTVDDLCLREFKDQDCKPFIDTFDKAKLPADFALDKHDSSVAKPESIMLIPKLNEYYDARKKEENLIPGALIEWSSPIYGSSRKNIKGYLLIIARPEKTSCRLYKFNTTHESILNGKKLRMQFSARYLSREQNYEMKVFSMPPPGNLESSQKEEFFVSASITTGTAIRNYNNPGEWIPSLMASNLKNGTLQVKIAFAPERFNLTKFEVQLVKFSHDQNNAYQTVYFTQPTNSQGSYGVVLFPNLEPDQYKAVVTAQDPFNGIPGKCLCWVTEILGNKHCQLNCGSVQTQYVNVTGAAPEAIAESTSAPTQSPSVTVVGEQSESGKVGRLSDEVSSEPLVGDSSPEIGLIIGVIASIVAVGILVGIVCYVHRRMKQRNELQVSSSDSESAGKDAGPSLFKQNGVLPRLTMKTVLIASCEDNPAHAKFVEELAKFLQDHYCKVYFPPWENIGREYSDWMQWAQTNLAVANYILLVDSESVATNLASYKLSRAIKRNPSSNKMDEIFKLMRQNIDVNQEAYLSKIIMVHYRENCGSSLYFQVPITLKLPEGFPDLLCFIHEIRKENTEAYSSCLPLSSESYEHGVSSNIINALKAAQGKSFMRGTSETSADTGIGSDVDNLSNRNSYGLDQESLMEEEVVESPQTPVSGDNSSLFSGSEERSIFTIAMNPFNGGQSGTDNTNGSDNDGRSIYTVPQNLLNEVCVPLRDSSGFAQAKSEPEKETFVSMPTPQALNASKLKGNQDSTSLRDWGNAAYDECYSQEIIPPQRCFPQNSMSNFQDALFDINSMTGSTYDV